MPGRRIPVYNKSRYTKNRILDTATRLFALKSIRAVSLKDIAEEVGIKVASIYYYYKDKDDLIQDVLMRFEKTYKEYHAWLGRMNEKAESLDEVLDNMFNDEFINHLNPIACLGMSLLLKEQHNSESSCKCAAFKFLYEGSVLNIQSGFDRLIEKRLIPASDTRALATLFMFCVMACNEVYIHEYSETEVPLNGYSYVYDSLRKLMESALTQGILETD